MTTDDLLHCGYCDHAWLTSEEPPICRAFVCPKRACQPVAMQIETTPAISPEKRTSIPDGWNPPAQTAHSDHVRSAALYVDHAIRMGNKLAKSTTFLTKPTTEDACWFGVLRGDLAMARDEIEKLTRGEGA